MMNIGAKMRRKSCYCNKCGNLSSKEMKLQFIKNQTETQKIKKRRQ